MQKNDLPAALVVGTRNLKKKREIEEILKEFPLRLMSVADFPDAPEVEEDAPTLEGNARKKALTLANALNEWVVADDSGLEIDALDGRPGVHSARYAGPNATDPDRWQAVLAELESVPDARRTAHFRCVIALARPGRVVFSVEGRVDGLIAREPAGSSGFGYDPIFYYPPARRTFGQMAADEKNSVSHRGRALQLFKEQVARLIVKERRG